MERRGRDAQAPVGATEFDDSGDEDQDIGEFEPSGGGLNGGALSDGLQVLICGMVVAGARCLSGVECGSVVVRLVRVRRQRFV